MNRLYGWAGGVERLRTQGELLPLKVLILPALFDEANRMRHFSVQLMGALVERGVGALLPDLPGTGESRVELERLEWTDWVRAVSDLRALLPAETKLTVAIRGGALLDGSGVMPATAARAWRLSPESGGRIVRMLDRVARAGGAGERGFSMSAGFRNELTGATPVTGPFVRTMRLAGEPGEADGRIAGAPLWRRAEPGDDPGLVVQAADDIATWARAG